MITFLFILILVFVAVDLLVRFVVDPLIIASNKKSKIAKSLTTRFDPTVNLAIETMYDGGKPHKEAESGSATADGKKSNDADRV